MLGLIVDLGAFVFALLGALHALNCAAGAAAVSRPGGPAAALQARISRLLVGLYGFVLLALMTALADNDFDLLFVAQNTNAATPLIYKIVGVWGNHEGSLVLWQLIMALYLALMVRPPRAMPARTHRLALWILGLVLALFYGFSAWLANPFAGNGTLPPGTGDLNVLLQDAAQAIHPPLLYLGYTGAGATFAVAVALLCRRDLDLPWADWVRPWALTSWAFLTAGIALGSFWAYYELGWGGWWFWDPVENLALLPWILGTALIHSLQVVRARQALVGWALLLAILTFLMVLLGTFIVRSGLLTSVHAFAADPDRGLYLLGVLALLTAAGLAAYAYGTAQQLPWRVQMQANRHGALLLNNLLLMTLFAAVLAGTLAPTLITLLGGETYVVRARFYVPTFVYPALGLLALMSVGVWTRWHGTGLGGQAILAGSLGGLLILAILLILFTDLGLSAAFMAVLGGWLLVSTVAAWARQAPTWRALTRLAPPRHGWALAHLGLALACLGMAGSTLLTQERIFEYAGAQTREVYGQSLTLRPRFWLAGDNFHAYVTAVELEGRGVRLAETRLYHPQAAALDPRTDPDDRAFLATHGQPSTEAALFRGLWHDTFVQVQDRAGGAPLVTVAKKVGVTWIWVGAALMSLGGGLALWPRRWDL